MAPRPGTAAMRRFPPLSSYDASARERRTAASDLDGTLLASSSAFPYYFLVALEAGGYLRAVALLLLAPFILLLYTAFSEPAAIGLLVFATFAGLREAYMVPTNKRATRAAHDALLSRVVFHDGRLVRRPDPAHALFALAYLPVGFALAVLRVLISLPVPPHLVRHTYRLTGIRLAVQGTPPPAPREGSPGSLLVCNHRTALDPIIVAVALGRPVTCVTYSVSRLSTAISPIPAVALARDREADAARIAGLLASGRDVVVCPEGTTCREPCLLRFSAMFAELSDQIVPVALEAAQSTYYGSTARGWKAMDPWFFYMNPRPGYKVTFLPALRPEETCGGGGRSAADVANHVQAVIAKELGYRCTTLTRKDKYMKLAGNDGRVAAAGDDDSKKFA